MLLKFQILRMCVGQFQISLDPIDRRTDVMTDPAKELGLGHIGHSGILRLLQDPLLISRLFGFLHIDILQHDQNMLRSAILPLIHRGRRCTAPFFRLIPHSLKIDIVALSNIRQVLRTKCLFNIPARHLPIQFFPVFRNHRCIQKTSPHGRIGSLSRCQFLQPGRHVDRLIAIIFQGYIENGKIEGFQRLQTLDTLAQSRIGLLQFLLIFLQSPVSHSEIQGTQEKIKRDKQGNCYDRIGKCLKNRIHDSQRISLAGGSVYPVELSLHRDHMQFLIPGHGKHLSQKWVGRYGKVFQIRVTGCPDNSVLYNHIPAVVLHIQTGQQALQIRLRT